EAADRGQEQQPRTGARIEAGEQQEPGQPAARLAVAAFAGRRQVRAPEQGRSMGREGNVHGLGSNAATKLQGTQGPGSTFVGGGVQAAWEGGRLKPLAASRHSCCSAASLL